MGVAKQRNKAQPNVKLDMNIDPDLTAIARELHVMEADAFVVAEHFIGQHIVSRNAALPVARHRSALWAGCNRAKYKRARRDLAKKVAGNTAKTIGETQCAIINSQADAVFVAFGTRAMLNV